MNDPKNLEEKLKDLRLITMSEVVSDVFEEAEKKNKSSKWILEHLADMELEARWKRSIENRVKKSKLYEKPTIDQFDFSFHSSRQKNRTQILGLFDLKFIGNKKDVIFVGNPGTGKSFLAKALAYRACLENTNVLSTSAMDMINQLVAAEADHSLARKLKYYTSPDLLICDELGYLSLGQQGSSFFFQAISARHGRASTVITTNLPFSRWGEVFDSPTVAVAIADRLIENSEVIVMGGPSYRKRGKGKIGEV